jgi:hypothetical protein
MASLATIDLPDDVLWTDEFEHRPVAMTVSRTLSGRLVTQSAALLGGRPITLDCGWLDHETLARLIALRDEPGLQMTLLLPGGRSFPVGFRHADPPAIIATPVIAYPDHDDSDFYEVTLKLMEF